MSDKMLEKLISSSVPHFSGIHYIWHGGEPLSMPLTFYKRALELEQKYKHNPNQNIKNSMQSTELMSLKMLQNLLQIITF